MECWRRGCKELNQIKNRIQRWLSIYFPAFVKVYCKIDTVSDLIVLENAQLPEDVLALGDAGLNEMWWKFKMKAVGMKKALGLYEAAKNSVDCSCNNGARLELRLLLADYRIKMEQYAQIIAEAEKLVEQVPNADKLIEVSCVGLVTIADFVAEVGNIGRYQSPKQVQKLAGLAPCGRTAPARTRGKPSSVDEGGPDSGQFCFRPRCHWSQTREPLVSRYHLHQSIDSK